MPTEATITTQILRYLVSLPECWAFKKHGGKYGRKGLPDIIGCYQGLFFAVEVKRPGGKTSPLQDYEGAKINNAGGVFIVAGKAEDVKKMIEDMAKCKSE